MLQRRMHWQIKMIGLVSVILLGLFAGGITVNAETVSLDSVICYEDQMAAYNFYTAAICGVCDGKAVDMEADYGFELRAVNDRNLIVTIYNNTIEDIRVESVEAQRGSRDYTSNENRPLYLIMGYGSCPDGIGSVTVTFNTKQSVTCAVFKSGDQLLVANVAREVNAENEVDERLATLQLLNEADCDETNTLWTEGICYPIMPVANGEATDVAYWSFKSDEIVEEHWSDAKKVYAFYTWIIDHLAYDYWVVSEGSTSRWALYQEYTGKYYISQTGVGVCEDFSQIFAIMCRTQGIPALVVSNESHAWSCCYLKDYGRWIILDATVSIQQNCYSEDVENVSSSGASRSEGLVKRHTGLQDVYIGNINDIALQTKKEKN